MKNVFLLMFLTATFSSVAAESYDDDWTDKERNRIVPVRIYLPGGDAVGPRPIVLLSHGLGGTRYGFPYLGVYWSKHGYVVVVMQHPGSDRPSVERKPGKTVLETMNESANRNNALLRVGDVRFVLDELERRNKNDAKLQGRLDLDKIGLGGHSFGAHTTLSAVGRAPTKPDPRIKAAIVMSPNIPLGAKPDGLFNNIMVPILHLTGTKDTSPIQKGLEPIDRRIPYDTIRNVDQYLVIFKDGNHMLFSGHTRPFGLSMLEKKYQPLIEELTLQFLNAYVDGNATARQWLQGKEFVDFIGESGTAEKKN